MRRRILLVDKSGWVGGSINSLYQLVCGLDRTRFEPVILLAEGEIATERFDRLGVPVITRPWAHREPSFSVEEQAERKGDRRKRRSYRPEFGKGRLLWYGRGLLSVLKRVNDFATVLRQVQPDCVHLNNVVQANRGEILACKSARVPCLCHVRTFLPLGRFDRWLASQVDRYIFVSQAIAEWFLGLGVKARAWDVVYNGVDTEEFRPMPEARKVVRAELGLPADAQVAAVVGRLVPWKGQEVFVDALARLGSEYPSLWGLVVGHDGGPFEGFACHLRAKVETSGMKGRVVFAGHRSDVNRVLAGVDVLVHSSVEPEPFGRVIVEGMAAEVPVVASAVGAVRELVEDGRTGLLYPPGDDEGLAQALERVIGTPELVERLRRNGRREVEARFRSELYVAGVEAVYETLA